MDWHKLNKLVEAINTYYAFALLVYATALYVLSHSAFFLWFFLAATPLLAGWTGYLLKTYLDLKYRRHGFKLISNVMTYEIGENNRYVLRFNTKLKAVANHLISYPIGYQWTGVGKEAVPKVYGEGQELLGVIRCHNGETGLAEVDAYRENVPFEREWHYWLVGFNPSLNYGDETEVKYSQEFHDKKRLAKPSLYYTVASPMKRLELNVKFPMDAIPKVVSASFSKPSNIRLPHRVQDVRFDPDRQWATWVIKNPKSGYRYRLDWKY